VNETQNLADPILLDTDVFSYLMKPGDPRGDSYRSHVARRMNAISQITLGELLFGAAWRNWNAARLADLRRKLRDVVILPFDTEVCEDYARVKVAILSSGRVIADNDLWIAATAIRYSIPLLSNNRRHFEDVPGLVLISEAPGKGTRPKNGGAGQSELRKFLTSQKYSPSSGRPHSSRTSGITAYGSYLSYTPVSVLRRCLVVDFFPLAR